MQKCNTLHTEVIFLLRFRTQDLWSSFRNGGGSQHANEFEQRRFKDADSMMSAGPVDCMFISNILTWNI